MKQFNIYLSQTPLMLAYLLYGYISALGKIRILVSFSLYLIIKKNNSNYVSVKLLLFLN